MKDISEFLEESKQSYLKRIPNYEEQEKMFRESVEKNESLYVIAGYPGAKVVDEHGREQLRLAIQKQNEIFAKVELIEELQGKYGF